MSNECDQNSCGYCGKIEHTSDECRDRLTSQPPMKGKPTVKKALFPYLMNLRILLHLQLMQVRGKYASDKRRLRFKRYVKKKICARFRR